MKLNEGDTVRFDGRGGTIVVRYAIDHYIILSQGETYYRHISSIRLDHFDEVIKWIHEQRDNWIRDHGGDDD